MTVLIAPDKFKGSLSAKEVCTAIHEALAGLDASLDIIDLPLADGGEGTCDLLTTFSNGSFVQVEVRDPLLRKITTTYGMSKDGKVAFLEMAKASGLQLLLHSERNPLVTSTAGTGDMIRHALDLGVRHIMMGIGGSATNDGGMGMAVALGIDFLTKDGDRLDGNGSNMRLIHSIDISNVHPRLSSTQFTVFCDVDNPLHGQHGAAHVFAPQKGANMEIVNRLDEGLKWYEQKLKAFANTEVNFPGAGAGGGLPASLKAFAHVDVRAGMDFIIEFIGLENEITKADVVITGEGKVDEQTLSGKVVKGVADLVARYGKTLVVIAGKCELSSESLRMLSVAKLITLTNEHTSEEEAIKNAYNLLGDRIRNAWSSIA